METNEFPFAQPDRHSKSFLAKLNLKKKILKIQYALHANFTGVSHNFRLISRFLSENMNQRK